MNATQFFTRALSTSANKSPAMAAIETLYECVKVSRAATLAGLDEELKTSISAMLATDASTISVRSATALFLRFITLASKLGDVGTDFDACRNILLQRGLLFIKQCSEARARISKRAVQFIEDGSVILTHSLSRVVLEVLKSAREEDIDFSVYVTESAPDYAGRKMVELLREAGIEATVILDAAAAYIMERVDFVAVGAEGVVENGGIVNKIGTYQIALAARAANKPVYAMAESIKFVTEYPLNQRDIPLAFKHHTSVIESGADLSTQHPLVDYTPPQYIRYLFTDLAVMPPAAVSDELAKLYL